MRKNDDSIIISICIATYNRSDFIGAALESIIDQINESIEVIIADGASTDNTKDVVLNFASKYQQIKYYKLDEKGGVDQDYNKAVNLAVGKYCWLFTDDDILLPGAIKTVFNSIEKTDYSMIVLNASHYSKDLSQCYQKKFLRFEKDKEYIDAKSSEQFFSDCANILSFIGCVIIKRDIWRHRNKELYYGSEFIHVGVIFQEPISGKILAIKEPLIAIRMNNSQWSSRALKIWTVTWPQLIWSFSKISVESKKKICPKYASQNIWKLLYYRALCLYSTEEYIDYIKPNSKIGLSLILAKSILFIPAKLINPLFLCYAKLRNRQWMVIDLMQSKQSSPKWWKLIK